VFLILDFLGVKDWFKKLTLWAKLRAVLLVFLLGVVAFGVYGKVASTSVTRENIRYHVREWLEDFRVENQKGDEPNSRFSYLVTFMGAKITIGQPSDHPNFLVVGWEGHAGGEIKAVYDRKSNAQKQQFWHGLLTTLLASNRRVRHPAASDSITIERWLPITKDLSEEMLYDAIEDVAGGLWIVQASLYQFLDSPNPLLSMQPSPLPQESASPP